MNSELRGKKYELRGKRAEGGMLREGFGTGQMS